MDTELALRLTVIAGLICASAFFSGSEAAFFSLGRLPLDDMKDEKSRRARALRRLMEYPRKLIITILIGNESVNILISILVASLFASIFLDKETYRHLLPAGDPSEWVGIIAIATTSLVMFVFCETLPKTAGIRFAKSFTSMAALPLYFFFQLFYPIRYTLRTFTDILLGIFGINPDEDKAGITDEDAQSLIKLGKEEGVLDLTEKTLLQNIFDFGDLKVGDVMTHPQDIFRIPLDTPPPVIIESVRDRGFSRVPVFKDKPDNIIGILHAKDMIRIETRPHEKIEAYLRKPYFIPGNKPIDELLKDFQTQRTHLALVVNEFGGIMGLVTMEDILEEIFGETSSEEPEEEELVELGEGSWEALGRMNLNSFKERFNQKLSAPGARTLGGYLLYRFGRVPNIGETISREGFRFTVKEIKRIRIHRVLVEREEQR